MMKRVQELIAKKDGMEKEMEALVDVLKSQQDVGLDGPLTDAEDYPRADIDVYTVRHARHQLACLQNDHKALMKEIEEGLYEVHAEARRQKASGEASSNQGASAGARIDAQPFLRVDQVDAGSPAAEAGLKVGDKIFQFGSVTAENFQTLKDVASVVQHSKDRALTVAVLRDREVHRLSLTPHTWSGRGLLGCNIVPHRE